jgi:ubiquinone/menaquinone biosynthesis C-methylase UbiE
MTTNVTEVVATLSMTVGRGAGARSVADLAAVTAADRVVDIGCGPGTAAREAARRGATVTGVEPAALARRLARRITPAHLAERVTWADGRAERLPVADGHATVVWALSSAHHWVDRTAALAEIDRVLEPGGRVLLVERLVRPGARGHAAHGLTTADAATLARDLEAAGLADVTTSTIRAGRRPLVVVGGRRTAV